MSNEHLKTRSKTRTRRVTTMLLASNIGFLALVGPAQIFYAISFDPHRDTQSNDEYKSFVNKGTIYQCLINTYYAASFVFCFASSSIFRREIKKILYKHYRPKTSLVSGTSEIYSPHEHRSFLQQTRSSGAFCPNGGSSISDKPPPPGEQKQQKRATESTIETDECI